MPDLVTVTAEHIARAACMRLRSGVSKRLACPLALAITEAAGNGTTWAVVATYCVRWNAETGQEYGPHIKLPAIARHFREDWDGWEEVRPFSFPLPDEFFKERPAMRRWR